MHSPQHISINSPVRLCGGFVCNMLRSRRWKAEVDGTVGVAAVGILRRLARGMSVRVDMTQSSNCTFHIQHQGVLEGSG